MIEQRAFAFDENERVPLESGLREQLVYLMAQLLVDYWKTTRRGPTAARAVFPTTEPSALPGPGSTSEGRVGDR